jgi:hypothetical protein
MTSWTTVYLQFFDLDNALIETMTNPPDLAANDTHINTIFKQTSPISQQQIIVACIPALSSVAAGNCHC